MLMPLSLGGVTGVALTTPITIAEGQSLRIGVSYDPNDGDVNYYTADGGSCPSATDFCIGGIDLVPTIVE